MPLGPGGSWEFSGSAVGAAGAAGNSAPSSTRVVTDVRDYCAGSRCTGSVKKRGEGFPNAANPTPWPICLDSNRVDELSTRQCPPCDMTSDRASHRARLALPPTLEVTQGQISSQSPTDATRFWWHFLRELTKETINLPLGCLRGGAASEPPAMRCPGREVSPPSARSYVKTVLI